MPRTYEEIKHITESDLEALSTQELRDLHTDINLIWNYDLYPVYVKATEIIERKTRAIKDPTNLDISMLKNLTPEAKAMLASILMSAKK